MGEFITPIISFLGGGVIVAVIQWARAARSERERRHSEYVREQLQRLYGPLYFLTSINGNLLELNKKILDSAKVEFAGEWSNDKETRESRSNKIETTINLANEYVSEVVKNNKSIQSLLHNNFAFIDVDDINLFQEFILDTLRMNKEVEEGQLKTPFEIYACLGDISYLRADLLERIKFKFLEKQDDLKSYH